MSSICILSKRSHLLMYSLTIEYKFFCTCNNPQKEFNPQSSKIEPSNFCPITPFRKNIITAYSKWNLQLSSLKPKSNIQRGFWRAISGAIDHTELLTHIIKNANNKQCQIIITLFDLKMHWEKYNTNFYWKY